MSGGSGASRNRICPACGSRRGSADLFCGVCGESLAPPEAETRSAVAEKAGERRWDELKPALVLWLLLLGTNGVFGLVIRLSGTASPWADVLVTLVDAVIITAYCYRDRMRLASMWSLQGLLCPRVLASIPVFAGLVVFLELYFAALGLIGTGTGSYLAPFREHGWPLWSAFALICLAPGIFEELAFRGQIMSRVERVLKPGDALIVQAAMFSVLHMEPVIFVSHFVFGLALGWLRRYTGTLYPGMLVHMGWNALVLWAELAT